MTDLDARLLAAHDRGDAPALVALYQEAALATQDETAKGFYLTHALVFALELGHPETAELRKKLVAMNRETPVTDP